MISRTLTIVCASFLITACGDESAQKSDPCAMSATTDQLLFVGGDTSFSANAWFNLSLQGDCASPILPDQSGDFVTLRDEQVVMAVNRTADQLNFRIVEIVEQKITFGKQRALPTSLVGDPGGMLRLDETHLLLVGFNSHALHVLSLDSGEITQSLAPEWDLAGDGPFFPIAVERIAGDRFAVLHQGYSADFSTSHPARIFEVTWQNGTLNARDLDATTDGIQGYELTSHLPSALLPQSDGTFLVTGLCGAWVTSCVPAIETFDPSKGTVASVELADLNDLKSYGGIVAAGDDKFLALVQRGDNLAAYLTEVDLAANVTTNHHTYEDANGDGFPDTGLIYYDPSSSELMIGYPVNDKEGEIRVLKGGAEVKTIATPAIPRQALRVKDGAFAN